MRTRILRFPAQRRDCQYLQGFQGADSTKEKLRDIIETQELAITFQGMQDVIHQDSSYNRY